MAQIVKSMIEVEVKVSAEKIFQAIKATSRSVPKLSPEKILSVEEQSGDDCKGTKNWTLSVDGKVEKMKERVEIDEKNKSMTVFVFDGDVMENYSSFKCNLQIIPKLHGRSIARWSWNTRSLTQILQLRTSIWVLRSISLKILRLILSKHTCVKM